MSLAVRAVLSTWASRSLPVVIAVGLDRVGITRKDEMWSELLQKNVWKQTNMREPSVALFRFLSSSGIVFFSLFILCFDDHLTIRHPY